MRISKDHARDRETIKVLQNLRDVHNETIRLQKEQIRFMKNVITDQSSMIDKLFSVCRSLLGQLDTGDEDARAECAPEQEEFCDWVKEAGTE